MIKNNYYTYKGVIFPERIGSIAYLSQNENVIKKAKAGIFLEMLGNKNTIFVFILPLYAAFFK
jgi:aminopeptidase-like protein